MSLSDHIASQIYGNFAFTPTADQKILIDRLAEYLTVPDPEVLLIVNGYAGTGKTTVIGALVQTMKELELNFVLLAPTGRAAKVMSRYAGAQAHTIHKHIYRERTGGGEQSRFELDFNRSNHTVYIVDEASMLTGPQAMGDGGLFGSGNLIDDLLDYIRAGRGNRVIVVGDGAQLPPVHYDHSPALDPNYMSNYGSVWTVTLSQVVRQSGGSGILHNATLVRRMIENGEIGIPRFEVDYPDVTAISGHELIEQIEHCYGRYGKEGTAIVCRSNKRAGQYNQGIRRTILDYDEEISCGDMLMVVRNNYYYTEHDPQAHMGFIANGDVALVRRMRRTTERYGLRFALCELEFPDYDDYRIECWVMLDTLHGDSPSLGTAQTEALRRAVEADYAHITQKIKRIKAIQEDEFYNALQVKFAYAATAHKAQGGQWPAVFLDTVLFGQQEMTMDLLRWLYTAVTRATEQLYLVNYDERFVKI